MTGIRCEALKVSLRDDEQGPESNLWMSEDAFGYEGEEEQTVVGCRWDNFKRQKILIVDDINDTGATFNWIKEDWPSGCMPMEHDALECSMEWRSCKCTLCYTNRKFMQATLPKFQ